MYILCKEKQINDGSYRTYLKAMTFDEILEVLDCFVKNNNIKKHIIEALRLLVPEPNEPLDNDEIGIYYLQ